MTISKKTLFCVALLGACAPLESGEEPGDEDVAEASDESSTWTPQIKWLLYGTPGTAVVAGYNESTGAVSVVHTYTAASQFRPVGLAGEQLMWQSNTTGATTLWKLDSSGNMVDFHLLDPQPPSGYRVVSISLSDDGVCDPSEIWARTYMVTMESPPHPLTGQKSVVLWLIDNNGHQLDTDVLPNTLGPLAGARDFRPALGGEWALLESRSGSLTNDTALTNYYRHNGTWYRLRTVGYKANQGATGCTLHPLPPPFNNPQSCPANYTDIAAGAGNTAVGSTLLFDNDGSPLKETLAWTTTTGAGQLFVLAHTGLQPNPSYALTAPSGSSYPLIAIAGNDDSDGFELICVEQDPRTLDPDSFGDLDLDMP